LIHIYILVEGQTEEAFVNELIAPEYAPKHLYFTAIPVRTSSGYKGGVVSFAKVKPQIERLCKQHAKAYVSTMFDLYALPTDFPGKNSPAYPATASGQHKASFLEAELEKSIGQHNFIPNLLVHEFEALLFTQIEAFRGWVDNIRVLNPLKAVRQTTPPEDINDKSYTAPSKRILAAMPGYEKSFHGPLIACDIGLSAMRAACPHFSDWLEKIEQLAQARKQTPDG
jgi:hypothetical protein